MPIIGHAVDVLDGIVVIYVFRFPDTRITPQIMHSDVVKLTTIFHPVARCRKFGKVPSVASSLARVVIQQHLRDAGAVHDLPT